MLDPITRTRVYKVSLLSGTDRSRASRRRTLWSVRVDATSEDQARATARTIHDLSAARTGRRHLWTMVEAVGKITVKEVR